MGNQHGAIIAYDESLESLSSRTSTMDDHELGFGFLDGLVKQQLIDVDPRGFQPHIAVNVSIERVDNTATTKGAFAYQQLFKAHRWLEHVASNRNAEKSFVEETQAKTMLVVSFKRAIAKRKIKAPDFQHLTPVKANQLAGLRRWPIELYGDCVCIEEYYGGHVSIALEWNHTTKLSASKVEADLNAAMTRGKVKGSLVEECEKSAMECNVSVEGFSLPSNISGDLTTVAGVMKLVGLLKALPIDRAVQVGTKTVDIQTIAMFPSGLTVAAALEDPTAQDKLGGVLQTLQDTGHKDTGHLLTG